MRFPKIRLRHHYRHEYCISTFMDLRGRLITFCLDVCEDCGRKQFTSNYTPHQWVYDPKIDWNRH